MDINIRPAQLADAAALADLLRSIGWFHRMEHEPAETTAELVGRSLHLCLKNNSHSLYVAEQAGGRIVGYVAIHWLSYLFMAGPEGFVSELFVHESARGQGIGSRLLTTAIEEARTRGCTRLQLINFRTRESYQSGFYAKAGWEERPEAASFTYYLE